MVSKISKEHLFKQLTWDDLQEWAGSRVLSRGQGYQGSHRVKELSQTQNGAVIAWVHGGARYATKVEFEDGELTSTCTCPYGGTCKHAVAVVLEYLDYLKRRIEIPQIDNHDKRLLLLEEFSDEEAWNEHEASEDYGENIEIHRLGLGKTRKLTSAPLKEFLEEKTKEQLIVLLQELAEKYSIVRQDLEDRHDLSKGSVKKLVAAVRKEIHELSSEPGWRNHWNNEGYIPDYSRVKDRLESLLKKGHADEVVALGRELLEAGIRQVEMSHDEGETGMEISSCLDIVFQALPQSTLSSVEQMLWVIDAELEDEYELCYGAESFWKKKQRASDWNIVTDRLLDRLNKRETGSGMIKKRGQA